MPNRKKDGFYAQKSIVLPKPVIEQCEQSTITGALHITDIGFYPKAAFHYRQREHGSPQNILIYCVDGEGWAQVKKQKILIRQGAYLILPKDVKHVYEADQHKPWSIFWLHFKGSLDSAYVKALTQNTESFSGIVSYNEERLTLFNNMYNTLQAGYSFDNLNYVSMLLHHYLASFCYPQTFNPNQPRDEEEIDVAIRYMQDHIHEMLTLKAVADHIHRSASHFSALFKKKTGYPPLEYFNYIKIQYACQMLEFTNLQVKELAYKLGFQDPYYFTRLFTKLMGLSPQGYRKKKKFN
ncbi:MAG: AraC family transcriptional regulator [Chitinophagaceae bacterium]|nr:AraC family transcriptional regulator [Chitinophagaceae bacterium]